MQEELQEELNAITQIKQQLEDLKKKLSNTIAEEKPVEPKVKIYSPPSTTDVIPAEEPIQSDEVSEEEEEVEELNVDEGVPSQPAQQRNIVNSPAKSVRSRPKPKQKTIKSQPKSTPAKFHKREEEIVQDEDEGEPEEVISPQLKKNSVAEPKNVKKNLKIKAKPAAKPQPQPQSQPQPQPQSQPEAKSFPVSAPVTRNEDEAEEGTDEEVADPNGDDSFADNQDASASDFQDGSEGDNQDGSEEEVEEVDVAEPITLDKKDITVHVFAKRRPNL